MSSGADKAAKSKGKAPAKPPKTKTTKGKEDSMNDQRFRGDGVKFKCKLVGTADVQSARGDSMCAEAIKKLKGQALKSHKEIGEHKQKIIMYINLKGIRIVDERTLKVQHEHPINKISFITHDPEDKKIFGYVCSQACSTGHKIYVIKSEKSAGAVTGTLYELFQIVFKLRQEAGLTRKVQNASNNSSQMANGPQPRNSPSTDGIYEVPYKNGKSKHATASPQLDHEYAEPVQPRSRKDPHYKVPNSPPLPATPSSQTKENNGEGVEKEMTASTKVSHQSTLLNQSNSFDKEPDQVSQTSIPDSPFPSHDNSANMDFFGSSVFDATLSESGLADTMSVASSADVSMLRTGSVSSASSETRSVHSHSDSIVNQAATNEGPQVGFSTSLDSTSDAGPSSDIKTTGKCLDQTQTQGDFPVSFPSLGDKEKSDVSTDQETPVVSNSDPFASSAAGKERNQPVAGDGFFTESFAAFDAAFDNSEVKNDNAENQKHNESSSDPFAPSGNTQEKNSIYENTEVFASKTTFEAPFSSELFSESKESTVISDVSQGAVDEKPFEEKSQSVAVTAVSFSWDNAFTEVENESKPDTVQSTATSEQQFSWAENFASDDGDIKVKTDPNTAASLSWDDAFGGAAPADKRSADQVQNSLSWDDAFGGKTEDNSNSLFDSSPFGDAFTSSTEDSSSNKDRGSEDNVESVPKTTVPDNPSFFGDSSFAPLSSSQSKESSADVFADEKVNEDLVFSKDPFEEFKISMQPAADLKKIATEENAGSSESEVSVPDQDSAASKESVSNEEPCEINAKEPVIMVGSRETVIQLNKEAPESVVEENSSEEEHDDQMNKERPSDLHVIEAKLAISQRPISPSAPPPLPPRPAVSAPPLPARPPSSSSTGRSPVSALLSAGSPTSNSPQQGKKGSAKKKPPTPPPRVDLNEQSSVDLFKEDPFGSDLFDDKFGKGVGMARQGNSDWTASWPSAPELPPKEKTNDPFNDSFFTDFDFPQNPKNNTSTKDNLDPFAETDPTSEPFPSGFGNEDLFAAFTPAKGKVAFDSGDPFQNDMSNSFVGFTSDDPFSDISDPFADKGILNDDPFADGPSKLQVGESLTLNESLVASDDADSFA